MKLHVIHSLLLVLTVAAIPTMLAQSAPAKSGTPAVKPDEPRISEYGQYSTEDPSSTFKPRWALKKQTTEIKIQTAAGFGIRYSFPGPFTEKTNELVAVTMLGPFGGPGGPIGFEFKTNCTIEAGRCAGDMIFPIGPGWGNPSALGPGSYTFRLKHGQATLEKTFVLAN